MEQHSLKKVNNCWNIKNTFYIETSVVQNLIHFYQQFPSSTLLKIRHMLQFEVVIFVDRCLILAVMLISGAAKNWWPRSDQILPDTFNSDANQDYCQVKTLLVSLPQNYVACTRQAFQASLIFVGMARTYQGILSCKDTRVLVPSNSFRLKTVRITGT